jgi:cell division protein FtsB
MDLRVAGQLEQQGKRTASAVREWLYHSRRKLATGGVFLAAAWLALHVLTGSNGWVVYQKKRAENRELQRAVQQLQKENDDLERRVKALKTDPKTIEKEAREQLRYAKPGEVIYVLPQPKPGEVKPPANATAEKR